MGIFNRQKVVARRHSYSAGENKMAKRTVVLRGKNNKSERSKDKQVVDLKGLKGVATIGEGSFGTVLLVNNEQTSEAYALKIQSKEFLVKRKLTDMVLNEISIMNSVDHPLLNTLHSTFEDARNVYMLLEYVPGGDMFTLISQRGPELEEDAHVFYTSCLISSLEALHRENIVYRDMKPENVLIDAEGYTRLVDFGFAKRLKGRTYTPCGTPDYFSPELISGRGYGKPNDIWGLGVLIYELMCGYSPFGHRGEPQLETFNAILGEPLVFHPLQKSQKARMFLSSVLQKNVSNRGGCGKGGIAALKHHIWLQDIQWDALEQKQIEAPWIPALQNDFDCTYFDSFEGQNPEIPEHLQTQVVS